jgi:hypothetical protein
MNYGRPLEHTISRGKIPKDLPPNVRKEIDSLYSRDELERAEAAYELGEIGKEASAAIPFLTGMLGDFQPLEWRTEITPVCHGEFTSTGNEAAKALAKMGPEGIEALKNAAKKQKNSPVAYQAMSALNKVSRDKKNNKAP